MFISNQFVVFSTHNKFIFKLILSKQVILVEACRSSPNVPICPLQSQRSRGVPVSQGLNISTYLDLLSVLNVKFYPEVNSVHGVKFKFEVQDLEKIRAPLLLRNVWDQLSSPPVEIVRSAIGHGSQNIKQRKVSRKLGRRWEMGLASWTSGMKTLLDLCNALGADWMSTGCHNWWSELFRKWEVAYGTFNWIHADLGHPMIDDSYDSGQRNIH